MYSSKLVNLQSDEKRVKNAISKTNRVQNKELSIRQSKRIIVNRLDEAIYPNSNIKNDVEKINNRVESLLSSSREKLYQLKYQVDQRIDDEKRRLSEKSD